MSDQRPRCAFDPEYPDAERCAQTLENCEDDLLTEAAFVRWQGQEIERLTAALQHEADCVEAAKAEIERLTEENRRLRADLLAGRNVVNAGLTIHTLTIERDMLSQEIERLTAERDALMALATDTQRDVDDLRRQLAEAEQDARRYRWLRPRGLAADFAYGDPPVCAIVFRWPESAKISANLDREIDAAMGGGDAG